MLRLKLKLNKLFIELAVRCKKTHVITVQVYFSIEEFNS